MNQLLYALIIHFNPLSLSLIDIFLIHVIYFYHSKYFDDVYKMFMLVQKKYS